MSHGTTTAAWTSNGDYLTFEQPSLYKLINQLESNANANFDRFSIADSYYKCGKFLRYSVEETAYMGPDRSCCTEGSYQILAI